MLPAQVSYWTLQENKRHNLVYEEQGWRNYEETVRHNKATEMIQLGNLEETTRHNLATEDLGYEQLGETQRHNIATEAIALGNLGVAESQAGAAWYSARSNAQYQRDMADIGYTNAQISRLRQMSDAEVASATASQLGAQTLSVLKNIGIGEQNAATNWQNAETNAARLPIEQQNADTNQINAWANVGRVVTDIAGTAFKMSMAAYGGG